MKVHMTLDRLIALWKPIFGVTATLVGLGASGFAVAVKAQLQEHASQTIATNVKLDELVHLQRQLLCIEVGIEPKLACLQK
jgi:hypothetical protein